MFYKSLERGLNLLKVEIDEGRQDTQKHINHPIVVNENGNIYKAGVITSLWKVMSERKRERKKFRIVQIDL